MSSHLTFAGSRSVCSESGAEASIPSAVQRAVNWGRSSCGVLGEELLHAISQHSIVKNNISRLEGSEKFQSSVRP